MLEAKIFKSFVAHAREENQKQTEQEETIKQKILEDRVELFFDSIMSRLLFNAGMNEIAVLKIPYEGTLEDYICVIKGGLRTTKFVQEELCSVRDQAEILQYMFSADHFGSVQDMLSKNGYRSTLEPSLFRTWACIEIPL